VLWDFSEKEKSETPLKMGVSDNQETGDERIELLY
jgi:hypothetical protein